jgi:chitinase
MTYDLMNRRDQVTNHHTSVKGSKAAIERYLDLNCPAEKVNLGFAFYAKYFTTQDDCTGGILGCPIVPAEGPTGEDTLTSGAWTFEKGHLAPVDISRLTTSFDGTCGAEKMTKCASSCCSQYGNCGTTKEHCHGACQHAFGTGCTDNDVHGSWQNFSKPDSYMVDEDEGAVYAFDAENRLFWTWDTPEIISRKFEEIVREFGLGGVMAWSLGEDSFDWSHIKQIAMELEKDGGYGGGRPAKDPEEEEDEGEAKVPRPSYDEEYGDQRNEQPTVDPDYPEDGRGYEEPAVDSQEVETQDDQQWGNKWEQKSSKYDDYEEEQGGHADNEEELSGYDDSDYDYDWSYFDDYKKE